MSVPEPDGEDGIVFAKPGFSVIATANSRDRGVNDLSSALKRRFNFVRIPVVTNKASEAEIVRFRTEELLRRHELDLEVPPTLLDVLLRSSGAELAPLLTREAGRLFPGRLADLDAWVPPWRAPAGPPAVFTRPSARRGAALLARRPATCDAPAELFGCDDGWAIEEAPAGPTLLSRHPATADALALLLAPA